MRVYLDACCLNPPFDDHSQLRVRLESEAVLMILDRCGPGEWQLIGSAALDFEVTRIADEDKRQKVTRLNALCHERPLITQEVERRAASLVTLGIKPMDAVHLACAEAAAADVMLTTDDWLVQKGHGRRRGDGDRDSKPTSMAGGGQQEMTTENMTANEIRKLGIEALAKALGPVGMARYIQQFDKGSGDYTAERGRWLDSLKLEDIINEIRGRLSKPEDCQSP